MRSAQSQVLDELADDFAGTAYGDDLLNILDEFGHNLDIRLTRK